MKQSLKYSIIAFVLAASALARGAPTVVANIHGYTLVGANLQTFSALAFEAGKVLEIGDDASLRTKYPAAHLIDGHGKTLLPGLIDVHGHVVYLGLESVQIQLTGTTSLQQAQQKIRAYAQANPRRAWLLGDGWNCNRQRRAIGFHGRRFSGLLHRLSWQCLRRSYWHHQNQQQLHHRYWKYDFGHASIAIVPIASWGTGN